MKSKFSINFTKAVLAALPFPARDDVAYRDTKEEGLSLRVTANGHKSFIFRKYIEGKQKRIILGRFLDDNGGMTVEQARKEARKIKGDIARGKNPLEKKEKQANEKTFGEAYGEYMEKYARGEMKPRSCKDVEFRLKKVLPHWSERSLSSIAKQEVRELHERIGRENGKYEANRVLAYIRAIYNKMISWDWEGINPTIGIKKFKETKRDRFVLKDELPKLMESLEAEPNRDMADFFLLCLYTGARKSNVQSMRWEDIDF
ncbi:MAG: integrase family protein, partial [Puniceicoccales bacterium]|nr:integrase family protein [Puniceicoccales bacterium]